MRVSTSTPPPRSTDAVILGGGPAGLAAAIALRQRNIPCLVVEALIPPIDKGCGEGLMPDALESLEALGISIPAAEGHPFLGIRFRNGVHTVAARFPDGTGLGVRRTLLHSLMIERAEQLGVQFAWGSHASLLDRNSLLIDNQRTTFRWLIGADGQSSTVRRWAGLEANTLHIRRIARRVHYGVAPWSDSVEVHWGPRGQLYLTPVAADCVCVVFAGRQADFAEKKGALAWDSILADFPAIADRLRGAPSVSQQRGALSASRTLRRVSTRNVALIGDASGTVDSVTGEGLALSFRQAQSLADCIHNGDLHPYQAAHDRIAKLPRDMARMLLLMDRYPFLQRHALRVLAAAPTLFQEMLAIHVGARTLPGFVLRYGPLAGIKLLTPSF
jgi:flavin-dependent dehydrogenase